MTQGGPAFLTSDITRWECARQKNTNKMYWRGWRRGPGGWQMCSRAPAQPPPGTQTPLWHSLSPLGEGKTTALAVRTEPSIASCTRRCVGVPKPSPHPHPWERGREEVTSCGSVSSREAAELPWDFAWRVPKGVFKDLRCFCGRLVVVIFCLVFVSFAV